MIRFVLTVHSDSTDIDFRVPETIDLSPFVAPEEHPATEQQLPEQAATAAAPAAPQFDAALVAELENFGFPTLRCQKAALAVKNAGVEPAMNWLLEHMEDAGECRGAGWPSQRAAPIKH